METAETETPASLAIVLRVTRGISYQFPA